MSCLSHGIRVGNTRFFWLDDDKFRSFANCVTVENIIHPATQPNPPPPPPPDMSAPQEFHGSVLLAPSIDSSGALHISAPSNPSMGFFVLQVRMSSLSLDKGYAASSDASHCHWRPSLSCVVPLVKGFSRPCARPESASWSKLQPEKMTIVIPKLHLSNEHTCPLLSRCLARDHVHTRWTQERGARRNMADLDFVPHLWKENGQENVSVDAFAFY